MKTYDALIRVSKMNGRKESADSTMTLTDQRSLIEGELARIGGRQAHAFEALDQSGFTVLDSPVVDEIIRRVESGASSGIVIPYGDRLARNAWHLGGFFSRMEKAGGEIHDASMPGIDYRTPEGRQLTMMRGVSSEGVYFAAKRRGDNIADQVVARGVPNAVPYGYRRNAQAGVKTDPNRDAKALVPDEQAAPIVRRIFQLRLDGHRLASIVRTLDEAGVPSPRGGLWTHSTVETIVKNEVYTGVVKLGKRRLEDAHTPLVSKADWKRVQGTRKVTHSGIYKTGVAGGLLECSGCGRPLSVAGAPGRTTYSCRRKTTTRACPRPVHVSKQAADTFVERTLIDLLERGNGVDLVRHTRELEAARQAVEQATAEKDAFVRVASALDERDFKNGYDERQAKVAAAREAYDELLARAEAVHDLPKDGTAYQRLPFARKRRVARQLIAAVVVAPPIRGGTIEERFTVRWAGARQVDSAGG
jgi:DNA invertase Pin-like site-specific DNA recombinase